TNRSLSAGTGNLLGISFSPSYRHRNLLGGAELLLTNVTAGVEVNPVEIRSNRFWNTIDLRIEASLFIPDFKDYLGVYRRLRNIRFGPRFSLLGPSFYTAMRRDANTRVTASYNYLLILDWYRYNLLNLTYGYDLQQSKRQRLSIDHFAVNVLLPTTEKQFQDLLMENPFLARSFGQQAFVSFLFRDIDYLKQGRVNRRGASWFFNGKFEIAGAELWAANKLYNAFADSAVVFQLGPTTFSQYVQAEADLRWLRQLKNDQQLAVRFNIGLGRPFGNTTDVPYVKQFYVGGANSMRAWAPRGLGPGGYLDSISLETNNNLRLYQTGDFKLELNAEYRFNLFWRLRGAFFLDAGNIWTIRKDEERPGSYFRWSETTYTDQEGQIFRHYPFYKQMAVAGGFGLRVDLSYFLFRFDVGLKLRNNYPDTRTGNPPESAWWNDLRSLTPQDFGFNLGLGLPF
ncbi:MAG: BamA/TamA family outer membrane protein, partial [Lewinella sp.]|nr:BamA/TamA family outer membrane protein [Lewinella sp.]